MDQKNQVITVCGFIYKLVESKPKLLVVRRSLQSEFLPGVIELPGGHVEFGENIEAALKREIWEELGISIKVEDCFYSYTYLNQKKTNHIVEVVYFAQSTTPDTEVRLNPLELAEYRWVSLIEFNNLDKGIPNADNNEIEVVIKGFEILANKNI